MPLIRPSATFSREGKGSKRLTKKPVGQGLANGLSRELFFYSRGREGRRRRSPSRSLRSPSTLTSFAALPAIRAPPRGDCGRSSPSNEGRPCGAPPRPPKPPRPLARCRSASAAPGEARKQFSVGQFAVIVFVQLLERGGCCLDFLGGDFAVTVRVERSHDRKHPHESTGTTRRASETAGTTGPADGTSENRLSAAATGLCRRDRSPRLLRSPSGCARLGAFAI